MTRTPPLLLALGLALAGCAGGDPLAPENVAETSSALTVKQAAAQSCTTSIVKGLSDQIVAGANCITPGAYEPVPPEPNLALGSSVYAFLEAPARDAFVAALTAKPAMTMTVNSMLRTVAQQYLLYEWYSNNQCGIGLAATPGTSNHESGLAFDVEEYSAWQTELTAQAFDWFGNADPVHYDYAGAGAVDNRGTDVLAFQKLWNQNNPKDKIAEDGVYGPMTQSRLEQSPADGFAKPPSCGMSGGPDVFPSITIAGASDVFSDHGSKGIVDLFEGQSYTVELIVTNQGGMPATTLSLGVWIEEPYLAGGKYVIESDWKHPGMFVTNEADMDPANPNHDAPGQEFTLLMHQLSPGETKRVTLAIAADEYSIGAADAPDVRIWVKDIPGVYHQDDFGMDPTIAMGQSFGPRLETYLATDVYSHTHWEFDSDRLEGWTPNATATVMSDPANKVLAIATSGSDPSIQSPATLFSTTDFDGADLRAKRGGGTGDARLYFATKDDPNLGEDKSFAIDLPDDDAFHEIHVDASKHAKWQGSITLLRFDPVTDGSATIDLDYLRMTASAPMGTGGASSGGAADAAEGSCSCRLPGAPRSPGGVAAALALLVGLALRRHRRPKPC